MEQKRVRMLLRVSSRQQLESDGDLSVQRQILEDYIRKQEGWIPDQKEYFEGSKSAYKNTAKEREVLQEILQDARNRQFDILVSYKDDRIGRLMWDTAFYIMTLKEYGVDVYSVKDGLLSPELDDLAGQMMLTFRYANAQKSSADTGMRVKDTAEKLAAQGKFMGGKAPYGYRLEFSGELSKHGRALKKLVIVPKQAEIVTKIYALAIERCFGPAKIAGELNQKEEIRKMAPGESWKAGTIRSILTNPVYMGQMAYKRRERMQGKYHRREREQWIFSERNREKLQIIEPARWEAVQEQRQQRRELFSPKGESITEIGRNDGMLTLIDVAYCGYCGQKLKNGTRYSYWTIQKTGEKKSRKIPMYRCPCDVEEKKEIRTTEKEFVQRPCALEEKIFHPKTTFREEKIEPILWEKITNLLEEALGKELQENQEKLQKKEKNRENQRQKKVEKQIERLAQNIELLEEKIPEAIRGTYPMSLEKLLAVIEKQKEKQAEQQRLFENMLNRKKERKETERRRKEENKENKERGNDGKEMTKDSEAGTFSWKNLFSQIDPAQKRVLYFHLIDRCEIKEEQITVRMRGNLFGEKPQNTSGFGVPEQRL